MLVHIESLYDRYNHTDIRHERRSNYPYHSRRVILQCQQRGQVSWCMVSSMLSSNTLWTPSCQLLNAHPPLFPTRGVKLWDEHQFIWIKTPYLPAASISKRHSHLIDAKITKLQPIIKVKPSQNQIIHRDQGKLCRIDILNHACNYIWDSEFLFWTFHNELSWNPMSSSKYSTNCSNKERYPDSWTEPCYDWHRTRKRQICR